MSGDPPATIGVSREQFQRELDHMIGVGLEAAAERTSATIPTDARLWAALTPGWTEQLAATCGFPGTQRGAVHPLFERMVQAGVFVIYGADQLPNDEIPGGYYVMTPSSRADTLRPYLHAEGQPTFESGHAGKISSRRSPIAQKLRSAGRVGSRGAEGAVKLLATAAQIGSQIHKASNDIATPPELRRWSDLAVHIDKPDELLLVFEQQVKPAFSSGDVAAIRDWIEVARPLAALFEYAGDARLSVGLGQAGRAVELIKRRESDYRQLVSFHRRDEQVDAVRELLDGPPDVWALHFIGSGGVGKTMALRYVSCLMGHATDSPCAHDANPFPEDVAVARIDFDYLNLDYPRLHPGLLLGEFARELRPAGTSRANRLFDEADYWFAQVQNELKAQSYTLNAPPSAHTLFIEGIRRYNDGLRELGKRVLLILDTCEELARADPEGGDNSTLEETFRILRALHDGADTLAGVDAGPSGGVPTLRVILSGRRLLSSSGSGWNNPDSTLPARPYLRLREIRGFTYDEARRYLQHGNVPANLVDAVIQSSSPDAESAIQIEYDDPTNRPRDVSRCNPYQLRLYMDWALENPPPDPIILVNAMTGQYVELRIVQRLPDPEVQKTLPVAALIGHFDVETLRAALDLGEDNVRRVFETLASQEWMGRHRTSGADASREILDMVPSVRDRLFTYYRAKHEPPDSAVARVAAYLRDLTLNQDLRILDWSDFDASLRVMEHDLAEGADWWSRVEARLLSERNLDWTLELLSRLLGKDGSAVARDPNSGPEIPPENALRPFVLAAQARVWLHTGNVTRLDSTWREVATMARAKVNTPAFGRLYRRALAALVGVTRWTRAVASPELVRDFWDAWLAADRPFAEPQDAASAIAAVEALVEAAEVLGETDRAAGEALLALGPTVTEGATAVRSGPTWLADALEASALNWEGAPPGLSAAAAELLEFSHCLSARAHRLQGHHDDALRDFLRALHHDELAQSPPHGDHPWADWLPPENVSSRIRLEFARAAYPAVLSSAENLEAIGVVPGSQVTADADRLNSLSLQMSLAGGLPPMTRLVSLGWMDANTSAAVFKEDGFLPKSDPVNAHRLVPPLVVTVCQVFAAYGLTQDALRQLRLVANNPTRFDLETVRYAERALLQLVRRLRLNDENESSESTLATSPSIDDIILTWTLAALDGPKRPGALPEMATLGDNRQAIHGAWQAHYALDPYSVRQTVAAGESSLPRMWNIASAGDEFEQASIRFDLVELRLMADAAGIPLALEPPSEHALHFDPQRWSIAHSFQPAEALCLYLRNLSLAGDHQPSVPSGLVARLGQRRAGELALEQGELLALRLPENAQVMVGWAVEQFRGCDDPRLGFIASTLAALLASYGPSAARLTESAASQTQPLQAAVNVALGQYEALRAGLAALPHAETPPDPEHLDRLVDQPTEDALDSLSPVTLRPWSLRLIACRARLRELGGSSAASTTLLRRWLDTHYGALVGNEATLPAEWSGYFLDRRPEREAQAPTVSQAPLQANDRIWPWVVFGLAVFLGLLTGAFFLWRWIGSALVVGGVSRMTIGGQILAFTETLVALLAIGFLGNRLLKRQRSIWASLRLLEVDIQSTSRNDTRANAPPGLQSNAPERMEIRFQTVLSVPRLAWRLPPYRLSSARRSRLSNDVAQISGIDEYRSLGDNAPEALTHQLQDLAGGVHGRRPLAVWLNLHGDVHGPCWEAMLTLGLPALKEARQRPKSTDGSTLPMQKPAVIPLHFRRLVETTRPPLKTQGPPYQGESLAVTPVAAAVVHRVTRRTRSVRNIVWRVAESLQTRNNSAQVVHLIGSAIRGPSGVLLRLAPEWSYGSQIEASGSSSEDQPVTRPISPADVRRLYPGLRLCILQGYPDEQSTTRLESDRYNAFLTRNFASAVAREGVAVIVIPPLDPTLGSAVWEQLFKRIPRYVEHGFSALAPAVRQMQDAIFESKAHNVAMDNTADVQAGWELALDICVYDLPTSTHQ